MTICLTPAGTLNYDEGGGHFWVFLNWALGLRSLGHRVIWLELVAISPQRLARNVPILKRNLERYGLGDSLALAMRSGAPLPEEIRRGCLSVEEAVEADLLLDLQYTIPAELIRRFSRSALVDLDPGLLQLWLSDGAFATPRHDIYFTIGETVGKPGTGIPDCGFDWHYTPPPVSLEHWRPTPAPAGAPYTTVAHWFYGEMAWQGETFNNDKRASFLDYLTLPSLVPAPLELALCLGDNDDASDPERLLWEGHRWSVRHSWSVTSTPSDYQSYIQQSRGEFSCAKPSCMKLQNAWVSDRTLCYLATGKPAIVQHTGASRILPDAAGLFRFCTLAEAAAAIERVEADYENQCRLARALAEEHFDARKVVTAVLEKGARMSYPAVAVLGYHKIGGPPAGCEPTWFYIPEETFEAQLKALNNERWRIIDLVTFLRGLDAPQTLPERAALITFDDGCRLLTDGALRILTGLGFPAVVFVPSEYIGQTNSFDTGLEPEEPICDWVDLHQLEKAGISVQSHSASHPRLSQLDEAGQARELLTSRTTLEGGLGRRVTAFAYPFGDGGSDPATMRMMMQRAGYEAAFLYGGGVVQHCSADRFHLPRIAMGPDTDLLAELRAADAARL